MFGYTDSKQPEDRYKYLFQVELNHKGEIWKVKELDPEKGMRETTWNSGFYETHPLGCSFPDSLPDNLINIPLKKLGGKELSFLREVEDNPYVGMNFLQRAYSLVA